ncbi:MAG: competence/damage-inducible protein A [Bdellovibrionales bacterium]
MKTTRIARLLTIGTEITSGEVTNSNAAWISLQLEELGWRVFSHLSVRDHRDEILNALTLTSSADVVIVTGGLGPTSDDITRDCVAEFCNTKLEFDQRAWAELEVLYAKRGLKLLEAHRRQCHFPAASVRLKNPVGTAWGFSMQKERTHYFVLPGPPRELEGMWHQEVAGRLEPLRPSDPRKWIRWTCLGAPESEVAEAVEQALLNQEMEVGYRAQVPLVKVKLFVDPIQDQEIVARVEHALSPWIVARGKDDPAALFAESWSFPQMTIIDEVCAPNLFVRLSPHLSRSLKLEMRTSGKLEDGHWGLHVCRDGEEFYTRVQTPYGQTEACRSLPFKISLDSERGRRSACEWVIWDALRMLRR